MSDIRIGDLQHSVDAGEDYFLAHYGVKGMKWGVRRYQNADGSLTDAGKKRIADKATDSDDEKREKFLKGKKISKLYGVDELREAKQKVLDADKLSEEYFNSKELQDKYKRKAVDVLKKKGLIDTDFDYDDPENRYFLMDDWDQGPDSSFSLFLKDRKVDPYQYSDNIWKAEMEYRDACKKVVGELLGKYGDKRATYYGHTANDSIALAIREKLGEEQFKRNHFGRYYI